MNLHHNQNFKKASAFSFIELAVVVAVIGALFGAILGAQSLLKNGRATNARALTKSSPVADMDNLALWLESTSSDSFDIETPVNNTIIANWKDINPKAITVNDVAQGTVINQPIFIKDAINGIPAVRFDGNDFLRNAEPKLPTENNERTLFLVVGNGTNNSTWDFAFHYGSGVDLQSFDVALFDGVGNTAVGIAVHLYSNDYAVSTQTGAVAKIISVTYKYSPTGTLASNMQLYINGQYKAADSGRNVNSNMILNTTSADLVIGGGAAGAVELAKVDVGEIIMFNRMLTTAERQVIESYLSTKWDIKLQ